MPTQFPQPTFWLLFGDLVWFLGFCISCVAVAVLVVWKSCFPKSRLGWGFPALAALGAVVMCPLIIPHPSEPYADGYIVMMYSLALVFLVCGVKPFVEFRVADATDGAKVRFGGFLLLTVLSFGFVLWLSLAQVTALAANARPVQCKNNLKQIGLALYNRAEDPTQSGKPSAKEGLPPMSWRVELLPYIDRAELRRQYRDKVAWDDPANLEFARTSVESLVCPSAPVRSDSQKRKYVSYALVTGARTECPDGRTLESIRLNSWNQTAIVIEACGRNIVWTEPRDIDVTRETISLNQPGKTPTESPSVGSSLHTRGVNVLFANGSVRTLPLNTDPKVLKALMTTDGTSK